MNEKLLKYILLEIADTRTQILKMKIQSEIEPKETSEFINHDELFEKIVDGMKRRADHEGISLDGLL